MYSDSQSLQAWHEEQRREHAEEEADPLENVTPADAVAAVLQFVLEPMATRGAGPSAARTVGIRAVAIGRLMGSHPVGGLSAVELGKRLRVTRALLSWHELKFSDAVGVRFRPQKSEASRESYRAARLRACSNGYGDTRNHTWTGEANPDAES